MGYPAWEPWQIELLESEYGKVPSRILAEKIGKKPQAINMYAHKHGISANRFWTEEETAFLVENLGRYSTEAIAKKLGKSYRGVLDKMNHMHLGNFLDNSDWLNLRTVSYLVSRDKETIKAVWFKHGFKMSHRGKYLMISESDLLSWMKNNPKYWDATECDYYFFARFDWFQEKLKADSAIKRCKRWNIEKEA